MLLRIPKFGGQTDNGFCDTLTLLRTTMKQPIIKVCTVLLILLLTACKSDAPSTPMDDSRKPVTVPEGFSFAPESPDADHTLTITFKASASSPIYRYTGDVYLHTGIISEGTWLYIPAGWDRNVEKCKMTKVADNTWRLTLSPSVREWYGSGDTPVTQLGLVVRSADGNLKGQSADAVVAISDTKYKAFEPGAIVRSAMPSGVREGINIINPTTVTFVLYDKDRNGVGHNFAYLVGDFNGWKPADNATSQMNRDDEAGCWWLTVSNLDPKREYAFQYYIGKRGGEVIRLADAYAQKVLDPDNDKYIPASTYPGSLTYPQGGRGIVSVVRTQPEVYQWEVTSFKVSNPDRMTIYEMLLRDFSPTGDLAGAKSRLDYIKAMGFDAVELMPVQEFDGNDSWGYNPCFYFAIDKAYGTPEAMKDFIDACHRRGLAVIFDVVYNHATGSMPFARQWWNASAGKTSVENPYFNVDAPHPYSVYHDLDHSSPLVRKFVKRNLEFLLDEYHVDGFRFDLAKGFTQNRSTEATSGNYDPGRVDIFSDYQAAIRAVNPNAVMILEFLGGDREEHVYAEKGIKLWRNANNAFAQAAMGWQESTDFSYLYRSSLDTAPGAWVGYMESHDEERLAYKAKTYGTAGIKASLSSEIGQLGAGAAFALLVPGPKMVWQFGELAYDVSIDENGRTGRKPLHPEYAEQPERAALHRRYTFLLGLRRKYPELFVPTATIESDMGASAWAAGKWMKLTAADDRRMMYVAGNFTDGTIRMSLPEGQWTDALSGEVKTGLQNIPAHSAQIFVKP